MKQLFFGKSGLLAMIYQIILKQQKTLHKLEKKLFKESEVAQEYSKVINQYLEIGYVSKVSTDEDSDSATYVVFT